MKRDIFRSLIGSKNLVGGVLAIGCIASVALGCICGGRGNQQNQASGTSADSSVANSANTVNAALANLANSANLTNTSSKPELELVKSHWREGGFGSVAIWSVTIKNNTNKKLGDIKYRTLYQSETGNVVSKGGVDSLLGKDTIEKIVPPKSSRTFEVNDGLIGSEAERAVFEIVSWREIP